MRKYQMDKVGCEENYCTTCRRKSVQMTESTELLTVDNIRNRVYFIRGQQVMLDYDLAEIYGYEVKRLNE